MMQNRLSDLASIASRLISINQAIARKQEEEISPKLDSLTGLIAESLMSIKLQENVWFSAGSLVRQEIRSLLMEDARCLLFVKNFQQFIRETLGNELLTTVSEIGVTSDTRDWFILSLDSPLKLSSFQDCDRENQYQYSIQIELGESKQTLKVPISTQASQEIEPEWDSYFQWQHILKQLNEFAKIPGLEQEKQDNLKCEISCLICYAAQIFHLESLASLFSYP